MELQTIVNEQDQVIGAKPRDEILPSDIYRVASVWVIDTEGNILLGKRAPTKKNDPDKLAPIVNGTVSKGETYIATALRETAEEIGLQVNSLEEVKKIRVKTEKHNFFVTYFKLLIDRNTPLKFDDNEICEVIWFTKPELRERIEKHPEQFISGANVIFKDIESFL